MKAYLKLSQNKPVYITIWFPDAVEDPEDEYRMLPGDLSGVVELFTVLIPNAPRWRTLDVVTDSNDQRE